jgi:ABC-type Fe3+/spermidine/putrescine transport system ATPase subunit
VREVSTVLEVREVRKSYEGASLLRGISFRLARGETACLLGPSGSGKSTLLRIIAGLEPAEAGTVMWEGMDLAPVAPHARGFGLMFQEYALFPHRNVFENVAFGLRMQNLPRAETEIRAREALARVGLADFSQRKVTDLSGGEQQRVALARALAPRPRLLMLDEPLGSLDRGLRDQLLADLRRILALDGTPALYVTHDQEEALAIADRLLLIHDGRIQRSGTPAEVYADPGEAWVAQFLDMGTLVQARVIRSSPLRAQSELGVLAPRCTHTHHAVGVNLTLLVRRAPLTIERTAHRRYNVVRGIIQEVSFRGDSYRATLDSSTHRLAFDLPHPAAPGTALSIHLAPEAVLCLK